VTVRAVVIANIQILTITLFQQAYSDGKPFQVSESWMRKWLHRELVWSYQKGTQAAQKLPKDYVEKCTQSCLRKAYLIKEHGIPAALFVNSDQTQLVYTPGDKLAWSETGAKQVPVLNIDEKCAMMVLVSVACDGTVLPLQVIFGGKSKKSLPSPNAPFYDELVKQSGTQLTFSGTGNYWSNQKTMVEAANMIEVYATRVKARDGLHPNQKMIWMINVYFMHHSEEFLDHMALKHPNIFVDFVPGGCTGIIQPCDVVIQRLFKHAAKRSYHEDVAKEFMSQLQAGKEKLTLDTTLGTVWNQSIRWLYNAWNVINNKELVKKVSGCTSLTFGINSKTFCSRLSTPALVTGTCPMRNGPVILPSRNCAISQSRIRNSTQN
jgi:hypothetical protein